MCKVAVTGGREHYPTDEELAAFWRTFERVEGSELHHGDARGVDRVVARFAEAKGVKVVPHPARWGDYHPKPGYKNPAGAFRNQEMVMHCACLIAFPGGAGTANAAKAARVIGRPCYFISDELARSMVA